MHTTAPCHQPLRPPVTHDCPACLMITDDIIVLPSADCHYMWRRAKTCGGLLGPTAAYYDTVRHTTTRGVLPRPATVCYGLQRPTNTCYGLVRHTTTHGDRLRATTPCNDTLRPRINYGLRPTTALDDLRRRTNCGMRWPTTYYVPPPTKLLLLQPPPPPLLRLRSLLHHTTTTAYCGLRPTSAYY